MWWSDLTQRIVACHSGVILINIGWKTTVGRSCCDMTLRLICGFLRLSPQTCCVIALLCSLVPPMCVRENRALLCFYSHLFLPLPANSSSSLLWRQLCTLWTATLICITFSFTRQAIFLQTVCQAHFLSFTDLILWLSSVLSTLPCLSADCP